MAPPRFESLQLPDAAPALALALAPHPDDFDAIGVTMRRLHERGCALHLVVATTGASGVDDTDCTPPTWEAKAALREAEQRASCGFFGLPEERLRFLRLPADAEGHVAVDAANVERVAVVLRELHPALVFLPHGRDANVTHQRVYQMLRAAAPAPTFAVFLNRDPKTIVMRYDVVTPFGEELATWKATLLRFHQTQQLRNLRRRGRGFDERILAMDRDSAATCGVEAPYAEVFELEPAGSVASSAASGSAPSPCRSRS
jgi:LmbE family N-acetylglucosaminyl deacetylase